MMSSYAISKFILTSILVISFVKCDKPATPGPVYSYYAPHPTTAATTTTTTLPPPPPAPYDPYYDSYYSPYTAPASGSGGLYYYNYAAEDTTAATAEEPETETDPTFLGLTITPFVRILILLVLASITLPHQMEITSVKRRRRDMADSSMIEQFGEYKNRFIQELTEEKFNCAKRIVCEWTSREDPDVQENIMMWTRDIGLLLHDLGYEPYDYIQLLQESIVEGTPSCPILGQCQVFDLLSPLLTNHL